MRRILVALDTSPGSVAAVEAAAALAALARAELVGVFVEDAALLRLAEHPLSREVGYASATVRAFGPAELASQLLVQAQQAEAAMARAAVQRQVRWSFTVVRGEVAAEIEAASVGADLVCLGTTGWSPAGALRLGSTVRAMMAGPSVPCLVLRAGSDVNGPLRVLVDTEVPREGVLAVVERLIVAMGFVEVDVVEFAPDAAEAAGLREGVRARLEALGVAPRFHWLGPHNGHALAARARGGLLVIDRRSPVSELEQLEAWLGQTDCGVVVV